MIFRV